MIPVRPCISFFTLLPLELTSNMFFPIGHALHSLSLTRQPMANRTRQLARIHDVKNDISKFNGVELTSGD